ncbi:histidinol dehydrogenase [Ohtaekwangia koreensis]|uniref:Histidinol dehydrogenase n=1 Tax=Ohtaekwangia koreensis TaxID=688867 RepID=A0A1T5JNW8_9BACT|nr:histidinol dehydrogenase [Ohtaekwangia koreensis]SKC53022.1 histidinol dehydrogenase [Ohtaekwangia koreensis]
MKIYINPSQETWTELSKRPQLELEFLDSSVRNVLNRVKKSGDDALRELTLQYDKVSIQALRVSEEELADAEKTLSPSLKEAIRTAAANIEKFHAAQKRDVLKVETTPGVICWRKGVAIDKVGIYIPGGSAPLFSTVLMLGVPAKLAGCKEVILCSPPDQSGKINAAILFAAKLVGVTKIFKAGGAQAIAAMAFGTQSIPKVHKIFGPGNQYVTKAKQLVMEEGLAIDMPAGPSEVLVMADETAEASFIAADLLSQAEHGEDSQVMLVLNNETLVSSVQNEIAKQLEVLPRKAIAEKSLANSRVVILNDQKTALDFINEYAPEHLILNIKNADAVAAEVINAGSVFIGNYSPEAIGDYASGTNHTLPTNGFAKAFAGVSLESFLKYITFQQLSEEGIKKLGPVVEEMAEAEQLIGHKRAVSVRLEKLKQP